MKKKTIKKIEPKIMTGKTVLQEFADFLSLDKGDRDTTYRVMVSNETLVIHRTKL